MQALFNYISLRHFFLSSRKKRLILTGLGNYYGYFADIFHWSLSYLFQIGFVFCCTWCAVTNVCMYSKLGCVVLSLIWGQCVIADHIIMWGRKMCNCKVALDSPKLLKLPWVSRITVLRINGRSRKNESLCVPSCSTVILSCFKISYWLLKSLNSTLWWVFFRSVHCFPLSSLKENTCGLEWK